MTIEEHALTLDNPTTKEQLEYIAQKANRLGLSGRELKGVRVLQKEKTELFFIVDELKPKNYGGCYP